MKRYLPFIIPFVVIVAAGGGAALILRETDPRGEAVDVEIAELDASQRFVRVRGMAHYTSTVTQHYPGNLFMEPRDVFLFPLFDEDGGSNGRSIRLFVRTERKPEDLVSYEVMTLEGYLQPATAELVPWEVEVQLDKETEYFLADEVLVLDPWRIEAEDGVWVKDPDEKGD